MPLINTQQLNYLFWHKLQSAPIIHHIFLQHIMNMLTTDIWDHSNHDDNEFNNQKDDDEFSNEYDDEEDDFGI